MARVDLYLGGGLGAWALGRVRPGDVRRVFSFDAETVAAARALGVEAHGSDAHEVEFEAAEFGFSVHYPRVIRPRLLSQYRKLYNLHPGFLPWGRGFYPVFWALWEASPAGATLHEMTEGLDEGPVVAQTRVPYGEGDTGGSLHARVSEAERALFEEYWPRVAAGEPLTAQAQKPGEGSSHLRREFFALKQRARVEGMSGAELLRLARCLSFPGYTGLEVSLGGRRFEVRLEPLAAGDDAPGASQSDDSSER